MRYLAAIIILASLLRFTHLATHPVGLYWDEYDTGYQAFSLLKTGRDYFGNILPSHVQSFADYRSALYIYLSVPFVKFLGLTPLTVRLTSAIFSIISIFFIYYISRKYFGFGRYSWIPAMLLAFSPWLLIQGRIAAESTLLIPFLMLGLIGFYEYIFYKRSLWLAAIGFALTFWIYGTSKLFIPVFLLLFLFVYFFQIKNPKLTLKNIFFPLLIFLLISCLPAYETFAKPIARRFSEISVFTDPTTASEINFRRLEAALGAGKPHVVGMTPSILEKAVYNKLTYWSEKILANYVSSLSTNFLFITGDPNLRHQLGLNNTGQLYLLELIPFILGLFMVLNTFSIKSNSKLLLFWLLLAPLPAIITRDGGTHAPRLLFLFPVLIFIISLGLIKIFRSKTLNVFYMLIYLFTVTVTIYYFFTTYRITSASAFNAGFSEAVSLALTNSLKYDRVIIDTHNESALLPYLFISKYDPSQFQKSFPLPSADIAAGITGYKFGNVYLLYPGTRDWNQIKLTGNNLVISRSTQPFINNLKPKYTILNPDYSTAFVAF